MKTLFIGLTHISDKEGALIDAISGASSVSNLFYVSPDRFSAVPKSPFSYWASSKLREAFSIHPAFDCPGRDCSIGASTKNDPRYLRLSHEIDASNVASERAESKSRKWVNFCKGGKSSSFYSDVYLVVNWLDDGRELKADISEYRGSRGWGYQWSAALNGHSEYFRPGLTWPRRTQSGLGLRAMPGGCIFADKGPAAFIAYDRSDELLALLAITTSTPFRALVNLQMAFGSYEVGVIQRTPVPVLTPLHTESLADLSMRAWLLKHALDEVSETSHAFILPAILLRRFKEFSPPAIDNMLGLIEREIDQEVLALYGLDLNDCATSSQTTSDEALAHSDFDDDDEKEESDFAHSDITSLISWCVGVAFGRFDITLATGERIIPFQQKPFDKLPSRSPGMLPYDTRSNRPHTAVLVDDSGHKDDLSTNICETLGKLGFQQEGILDLSAVRSWLARTFWPLHIREYSKSRRKAPIYWQLATSTGSYSVWLYIHAFTVDTLHRVRNDYVALKLAHEVRELSTLRAEAGSSPSISQRKAIEVQEAFVDEITSMGDELARVAPLWAPNLDDGVLVNSAPLWRLFSHNKSWQKEVKLTWGLLCTGQHDWSHLAMRLWPERVIPKCAADRSLAIAHGLEDTFWCENINAKWEPRRQLTTPIQVLINERTVPSVKDALQALLDAPDALDQRKSSRRSKGD